MQSRPWKLEKDVARLQLDQFGAKVNLAQPDEGLVEVQPDAGRLAGAGLLGIAIPLLTASEQFLLIERYVRGPDLVAAYEESAQWPVRVDALWRVASPAPGEPFVAAVELLVSVRTRALDSRPELAVQSRVPAAEVLRLIGPEDARYRPLSPAPEAMRPEEGPGCLLFRLPRSDFSYAEMVHPADFQYDELTRSAEGDGTFRISHRLFSEPLEKGVIRRARVEGVFLPRSDDMQIAAAHYTVFAAAEPPLAT